MLKITIPMLEKYDEYKNEFVILKEVSIQLEHSLVSISKWESKHHKPFISKEEQSIDETIDYIRCMNITQGLDDSIYCRITNNEVRLIREYIDEPMTATTISELNKRVNKEIITSEIIYYWMISLNIPFECQKWHLNKLLTLINVCSIKNTPPKKMSKKEILNQNSALNAKRRQKHGSG